jgi:GTP-binding protein
MARGLFASPPIFLRGAHSSADFPPDHLPEVAFLGRSNVGKSSLLNALFGRRDVARTSSTPGRTQQLNFFAVKDRFVVVDLPGYGFAKVPKKQAERWQRLTIEYLADRRCLKRVYLLIDSRHGTKQSDREIMHLLDDVAVSYQIVLTKADKLKASEIDKALRSVKEQVDGFAALYPEMLVTSAEKMAGVDGLREAIAAVVQEA